MDRGRVQNADRRGAALLALGQRLVGHLLHHVEDVAVLAFVLVDRHGLRDYRSRYGSGMSAAEQQERSNGLIPSNFDAWLRQQRERGKYTNYDPDLELHERS